MPDSRSIEAEREVQRPFRKTVAVQLLAIGLIVVGFEEWMDGLSDREELGWRTITIETTPAELPLRTARLTLAGAWRLESEDPRFGGISALAQDRDQFVALTDSGAIVRFPRPSGLRVSATVGELPDGPGDIRFKSARDSESLMRDARGRGWWVGFENRHSLWLFDPGFRQTLARIDLRQQGWHRNGGAEGLAMSGNALVVFPEHGRAVVQFAQGATWKVPIAQPRGRISDAAILPDGRLAVIQRHPTIFGFRTSLGILDRSGEGYRYVEAIRLPVSPIDNVEAITIEPQRNGTTRLWMMTDNNYHAPLRTLLFAYDMPPERPSR